MMMFSADNGFGPEVGLGYAAAGLSRLNARSKVFMEPLKADISGSRVVDLASLDGRWSYAALRLGARHVTGIEVRPELTAAGAHLFADPSFAGRYEFVAGDLFDMMPALAAAGRSFDVVLCLGIFYHVVDHFRLLRLIKAFDPRLVILDTSLVDDEKPFIALDREPSEHFLNGIANAHASSVSVIGIVSKGGLRLMADALGFDLEYLPWTKALKAEHRGIEDYYGHARERRKRFSAILRRRK